MVPTQRVAIPDLLVGPDRFRSVIDCDAAAAPATNVPVTFSVSADVACTVTFTARTITVVKNVGGPPIAGFDVFDFEIFPEVDTDTTFSLADGEEHLAVVPVGRSVDLTEFDPGPYGVTIECTEQTPTGPIFPFTGPLEFSNFIEITDPTTSFYCEVFNDELGPIVHEVTVESEMDLAGLDVPSTLPGFFVDFDGDLAFFDDVEPAGSPLPWRRTVPSLHPRSSSVRRRSPTPCSSTRTGRCRCWSTTADRSTSPREPARPASRTASPVLAA